MQTSNLFDFEHIEPAIEEAGKAEVAEMAEMAENAERLCERGRSDRE